MQIICPSCNYSKDIDPAILPPDTSRATCPKCGENFALSTVETPVATEPPETEDVEDTPLPEMEAFANRNQEIDALPKAGFWMRVVATMLDGLIVFVLQFALSFLLAAAGSAAGIGDISGLIMLFGYVLSFAYYIVFTGYCGQTPGKMALRIKVIRTDGSQISYGRAAFREVVAKFISGIILGIGYLMVAFDEQKQGLHDRMSDTYVIKL